MSLRIGNAVVRALNPAAPTIAVFGGSLAEGSEGSAGYDCVAVARGTDRLSVPSLIECALPLRFASSGSDFQRVPGRGQRRPSWRTNLPARRSSRSPSDIHSFT